MWDKVSLRKELIHRRKEDRIMGIVDYGDGERPKKLTSHAWIGMVKGLCENSMEITASGSLHVAYHNLKREYRTLLKNRDDKYSEDSKADSQSTY